VCVCLNVMLMKTTVTKEIELFFLLRVTIEDGYFVINWVRIRP